MPPKAKAKPSKLHPDLLAMAKELNDPKKGLGEGTIVIASEIEVPDRISTGSLALDAALGGGWPVNQWHEINADFSSGKTTLLLKALAFNQEQDAEFTCLWVATETFDRAYAELLGVDLERVIVVNERIMENAYQVILKYLTTKLVDMIVLDSLPAMTPGEEAEKLMEEVTVALGARLTNKFFRKQGTAGKRLLTGGERPCTCFIINQPRFKIGVTFGSPMTTGGGQGKEFAYYTKMELRRDEWIEVGPVKAKVRVGQTIVSRITKNKSFPPQKVARWDYYFMDCTDSAGREHPAGSYDSFKEIVALGVVYGVITQNNSWFSYEDLKTNGMPAFLDALPSDMDLSERLERDILAAAVSMGSKAVVVPELVQEFEVQPTQKLPRLPRKPEVDTGEASTPQEAPEPVTVAPAAPPRQRRPAKASG